MSNQVNRVSMSEVEDALRASNGSTVNVTVTPVRVFGSPSPNPLLINNIVIVD